MAERFFVAQTLPVHEEIAAINLRAQDFEVFYPTRAADPKVMKRIRKLFGGYPAGLIPIISGYVFVRFDRDASRWRSINGTRGVRRILGEFEKPTPVPIGVIEEMKDRWATGDYEKKPEPIPFRYGDKIRITAGPFADRRGEVEEVVEDEVQVILHMFGRLLTAPFRHDSVAFAG